jgi:hypothetical protein
MKVSETFQNNYTNRKVMDSIPDEVSGFLFPI